MKEVYDLKDLIMEKGCLEDSKRPFELREVEERELQDFLGAGPKEGIKRSIMFSLQDGNIMFRALCKHTGALLFVMGLARAETPNLGVPWMLSSKDFKPSIEFIRASKRFIEEDAWVKGIDVLSNYIHEDNTKSIKWLKWLGFTFIPHPFKDDYYQFYKYKE